MKGKFLAAVATAVVACLTVTGISAAQETRPDAMAAPSAVAGTIVVSPSVGLADNQRVQVDVSGFPPSSPPGDLNLSLSQCPTQTYDDGTCLSILADAVSPAGTFSGTPRVHRTLPGGTDCALSSCFMLAVSNTGPSTSQTASTPISFDPDAPSVPPFDVELTIDTSGPLEIGADGTVQVSGTLTCEHAAQVVVTIEIVQGAAVATDDVGFALVGCNAVPSAWTVIVSKSAEGEPPFFPGPAVVRGAVANDSYGYLGYTEDSTVTLIAPAAPPVALIPAFTG